jgi:hypothetical protein
MIVQPFLEGVLGVSLILSDHLIKRCLAKFSLITAQLLENENFILCAKLTADHAHHSMEKPHGRSTITVNPWSCTLAQCAEWVKI